MKTEALCGHGERSGNNREAPSANVPNRRRSFRANFRMESRREIARDMFVPLCLFIRLETALKILAPCLVTKIDLVRNVALRRVLCQLSQQDFDLLGDGSDRADV
jgi:hypothetical protein